MDLTKKVSGLLQPLTAVKKLFNQTIPAKTNAQFATNLILTTDPSFLCKKEKLKNYQKMCFHFQKCNAKAP